MAVCVVPLAAIDVSDTSTKTIQSAAASGVASSPRAEILVSAIHHLSRIAEPFSSRSREPPSLRRRLVTGGLGGFLLTVFWRDGIIP